MNPHVCTLFRSSKTCMGSLKVLHSHFGVSPHSQLLEDKDFQTQCNSLHRCNRFFAQHQASSPRLRLEDALSSEGSHWRAAGDPSLAAGALNSICRQLEAVSGLGSRSIWKGHLTAQDHQVEPYLILQPFERFFSIGGAIPKSNHTVPTFSIRQTLQLFGTFSRSPWLEQH